MNRKTSLGGLVVLNVVLIVVLGLLSFSPQRADAQLGARAGDYIMVAGSIPGRTESSIFITDLSTGALIAVQYDQSRRIIQATAGRDVAADFRQGRAAR